MLHVYLLIEDLGLAPEQRAELFAEAKALGPRTGDQPAKICHHRMRPDGGGIVVEADFDPAAIGPTAIKGRLAARLGVDAAGVTFTTGAMVFGTRSSEVTTYRGSAVERLRLTVFGGRGATWDESRREAITYLLANRAAWGD